METRGGGSTSIGGSQAQTRIQTEDPILNPLVRQGSLYSLTLDEVQNQLGELGKPLCNMNLDELLKTVWIAEANSQAAEGVDSGLSMQLPGQPASAPSLDQQLDLMLSTDLSRKTVDEVWQDIQQGQKRSNLDRKTTLGEMTLEDFLAKAGVVAKPTCGKKILGTAEGGPDPMGMSQCTQWMNYQIPLVHPQQPTPLDGNAIVDTAYLETQITMSSSPLMGTLSDTQTPGRKRVAPDDIAEKSVERRQKRMIKNRESAARSRARKQAYTHELENKISLLEEENERLKREKEIEKVLPSVPPPEPKHQLRRTSSAPI